MKKFFLAVLMALVPVIYLAVVWNALPEKVPLHYGTDLQPDQTGDKSELWILCATLGGVSLLVYLLLTNLHRIDPKRKGTSPSPTFNKLAFGLVVFFAALNLIFIAAAKGDVNIRHFLFPLIGLLLAFIGNYFNNIKPNYFAGIRLPWTLSSDENWRRTHQLAGKLWFAGGVLIAVTGWLLPSTTAFAVFIGALLIMILIPVIYSYRIFKREA